MTHGSNTRTKSVPKTERPLLSTFAGDPEMAELVTLFVGELPSRVELLRGALRDKDWNTLRRTAHQLKGASGGYGFAPLGNVAGELENIIASCGTPQGIENEIERVRSTVEELISMCQRAKSG